VPFSPTVEEGKEEAVNTREALRRELVMPILLVLVTASFPMHAWAQAEPTLTVGVKCGTAQTIARALRQGDERKPLAIIVDGRCTESVVVDRDDVTLLAGGAGGSVHGPDANTNTITVTGSRVTIDGLTVTGGLNGIRGVGARGLTIANCTVQNTGRSGISLGQGTSGRVDACTVQNNPRDGVAVESSSVTVVDSSVSHNARVGILLTDGASGRIGVNDSNAAAGNMITNNGSNGVHISIGGTAFVGANTISGNGTNPAGGLGRFGIGVFNSTADIIGSNSITDNANHGIFARSSSLLVGDTNFGISSVNTLTGNGTAVPASAGIFAFVGNSLVIRNAIISRNNGFGVVLSLRSSAQMSGNTIQDNTGFPPFGDGIRLVFGSGLFIDPPPAARNTVTGNTGFGLNCTDGEASVVNTGLLILTPPDNDLGGVSDACTGFE
jgi:parallel beta helix pectate lyase-like protein